MCVGARACARACVCKLCGCAAVEKYHLLRCVRGLIVGNKTTTCEQG